MMQHLFVEAGKKIKIIKGETRLNKKITINSDITFRCFNKTYFGIRF